MDRDNKPLISDQEDANDDKWVAVEARPRTDAVKDQNLAQTTSSGNSRVSSLKVYSQGRISRGVKGVCLVSDCKWS